MTDEHLKRLTACVCGSSDCSLSVLTRQKESDQQITAQVEGSLTTYTQTGLAAGQDYRVSIVGEIDGRRGGESTAEFMTREVLFTSLSETPLLFSSY